MYINQLPSIDCIKRDRILLLAQGALPDGQEVAVKRLSESTKQGLSQMKNELALLIKLQHKNLVRIIGICLEEGEHLLVYEYMPNKSLDTIIFGTSSYKIGY